MQTFLPYPYFAQSAMVLDYRRLGKQRVEAFQLLVANGDEWAIAERTKRTGKVSPPKGWTNHPAAVMWQPYSHALRLYYNTMIKEWVRRGYNNTMREAPVPACIEMPPWLGNQQFHASHRSNLLRKDPHFYSRYNWNETSAMEYFWPNGH